jgi:hypothetical protein
MNHVNGREPCTDDCAACASEKRLWLLAQKLNNRGLDARLVTCGTVEDHKDALSVTNPHEPGRGLFHVDDDGSVEWAFPGAGMDDKGIDLLMGEAINALRANGVPLPKREVKQP